jgi:hypothetical protein
MMIANLTELKFQEIFDQEPHPFQRGILEHLMTMMLANSFEPTMPARIPLPAN